MGGEKQDGCLPSSRMSGDVGPHGCSHGDDVAAVGAEDQQDCIRKILNSMGADLFDPRVVSMLRELMYRYVGEVLKEGQVWADARAPPSQKLEIDVADMQMAVEHKIKHRNEFAQRPEQAMLRDCAATKNSLDLPQIPRGKSLPLPTAKRFCLTADNFQVLVGNEKIDSRQQQQQQQQLNQRQQAPHPAKRARMASKWGESRAERELQNLRGEGVSGPSLKFVWLTNPHNSIPGC